VEATARIREKAVAQGAMDAFQRTTRDAMDVSVKRAYAQLTRSAATIRGMTCVLTNVPTIAVDAEEAAEEHRFQTDVLHQLSPGVTAVSARTVYATRMLSVA